MAGWNKGFFLASPDGNFKLNVSGFMQVRYTFNHANKTRENGGGIPTNTPYKRGFENANTWLDFSGNVVDPSWTYHIRGNFANDGIGEMALTFASISKDFGNGWSVTAGQFRGPWLRETLVDDPYQLGVDRSVMNDYFTQGFDQGIQVGYEADAFRVNGFFGDGVLSGVQVSGLNIGSATSNSPWQATPTNYAVAARGEYKISGDWAQFDDFTSRRGEEAGMMVGLAGVAERGNANSNFPNTVAYGFTADFSWEMNGANLFASFVWLSTNGGAVTQKTKPWGFNVQGGYFVTDDIEIFGRYEIINYKLTGNVGGDSDKYNGLSFGANYFFADNVKGTVGWSSNFKSFGSSNFDSGFREDVNGAKNQWALRGQLQLLF